MMTPSSGTRILGVLVLALVVGIWVLRRQSDPNNPTTPQEIPMDGAGSATNGESGGRDETARPGGSPAERPATSSANSAAFNKHVEALAAAAAPEDARAMLEALRGFLSALPPEIAATFIRDYLATGDDAALPLLFKIGPSGFLSTPPTIRVALLDFLGWIQPQAAATLGREILATPTSPDEWAVSLRNVASLDTTTDDREYLRRKTEELIRNSTWQEAPSIGYLNAFDVLVHTEATASAPLLSELIQQKDRRDLAHAGFITLDRLTQRKPVEILTQLADDRALHSSRPEMIAQQFARADLRVAAQRGIVHSWLLDPARTPAELRTFSGSFPNNNQIISTNLLTRESTLSGAEMRSRESVALRVVGEWQDDPRFKNLADHLDAMTKRLRLLGNE